MAAPVVVIGAGWSGLAAAVELAAAGRPVLLLESARQPGGRARSISLDGETLDNGQHLLSGAYARTLALLARIGVDSAAALLRLPLHVCVPGRFELRLPAWPAPLHLAAGLLAARGAGFADKLRAVRLMRRLQATGFRLAGDATVADWLDAHGQRGGLRRHLWEALCLAALNTPPLRASAQIYANVLRDTLAGGAGATDLLLPRVDLGRLAPEPAVSYIRRHGGEIRFGARVRAIATTASGLRVSGDDFAIDSGAVILACAPQHAAALLPQDGAGTATRAQLAAFAYEPIITVYLRYPASVRLPLPLLLLDTEPAQWVFDRGRLGNAAGLIAHVLSGSGPWQADDNALLAQRLHAALQSVIPGLPEPLRHSVVREQRATFACVPGLSRPANASAWPGLWLAGDYTAGDYPATIEAAVRSGEAAAGGVLAGA